jgi:hypothetical protein
LSFFNSRKSWRRRIKENDGGDEFNYDILKNICKCHNVSPRTTIIKIKGKIIDS